MRDLYKSFNTLWRDSSSEKHFSPTRSDRNISLLVTPNFSEGILLEMAATRRFNEVLMNLPSGFAGDGILSCEAGISRLAEPAEASEAAEAAEAAGPASCSSGKSAAWFGLDFFAN
jgi:hypothetical protein